MDANTTLLRLLELRAVIDAALQCDYPVDSESLCTFVGLLDALDLQLRLGYAPPSRWGASFGVAPSLAPVCFSVRPSNDNGEPRRRSRVRGTLIAQLALPLGQRALRRRGR